MKKSIFLLFLVTVLFAACRKKTEAPSIFTIITNGKWKVDRFINNGTDQTALYKDWVFTFSPDNRIASITNGVEIYRAAWLENETNNTFSILVNSPDPYLLNLNLEWVINYKTPQLIQLRDQKVNPSLEVNFVRL
jgi:hypothetical protein